MNAQLCYFGGSGGFFALWHILLGTDYYCCLTNADQAYNDIRGQSWPEISELPTTIFDLLDIVQEELTNNQEWKAIVEEIIENKNSEEWKSILEQSMENNNSGPRSTNSSFYKSQWDVSKDRSRWKETEKWPNNKWTQKSNFPNKLFFHHNPTVEDIRADCNKKILLYTDIETQTMLAKNKNAWVYSGLSREEMELKGIKQTTKFNNIEVYYKVDEIAKYTDYQIRLQDVVSTQGQALLDVFDSTINESNIYHNNMWLNLHTNEEKGLLSNES